MHEIAQAHACESIPCGKAESNINTHALVNYMYFNQKR